MPAANELLLAVIGAVADGKPVDWSGADATPMSDEERLLLEQIKVLDRLYRLHQSGEAGPSPSPREELHTGPSASLYTDPAKATSGTSVSTVSGPIPSTWGPLEIRGVLGAGSFGVVYRAWDPRLASEVALKVLNRDSGGSAAIVIQEARLLARVRHPNIVSIFGADRWEGQVGLWMELVSGRTLKQVIKQQGTFGAREAALVGLALTRALAAVHAAGLVHRDVKPHNVMRDDRGRVVLMDFGAGVEVEELSQGPQHKYVGTPLYMAPELFDHHSPSPQTDLYSLGVLLYHLVTAAYPVDGSSPSDVQRKHESGQRRRLRDARPDLPTEFVRIVERAIDPDVAARFASAGELEDELVQFVVTEGRSTDGHGGAGVAPPRRRSGIAAAVIACVALLVAAGFAAQTFFSARNKATSLASAVLARSLAVLPFANLSEDSNQEYFADGMTDLLINELSMVSSLRVTSRTSTMVYKSDRKPVTEVARDLKVDGIVEGSVNRSGDRLRVNARLILAGSDVAVWSKTYERLAKDAFSLQAEIARDLANGIRATVTAPERRRLQDVYAAKPEAQDLYLRGLYLLYQFNPDRMKEACDHFERAVQVDAGYAQAWSSLARCYVLLENYGRLTPASAQALVTRAAGTALAQNPSLAEAHLAWAEAKFKFDWNWREADENYRQAVELNPSFSFGRTQRARFLAAAGRTSEAVAEAQRAQETDPLSPDVTATLAMMTYYDRRYDQAVQYASRAVGMNPRIGHVVRGRAHAAKGEFAEAVADLKQALSQGQFPALQAELGRTYAAAGSRDDSKRILDELLLGAPADAPPYNVAYIFAALGQSAQALEWLEKAVHEHSSSVLWLRVDPNVDSLRGQPRFEALLKRIGGLQ